MEEIDFLSQHESGRRFVAMLINECYESLVPEIMAALQSGPPGNEPSANEVRTSNWFRALQESDQKQVQEVVEFSLDLCLFHLLNVLDGTSPVPPMEIASDFALYLQTYDSDEDQDRNSPRTTVRVNPAVPRYEEGDEQLHDIFSEIREDMAVNMT